MRKVCHHAADPQLHAPFLVPIARSYASSMGCSSAVLGLTLDPPPTNQLMAGMAPSEPFSPTAADDCIIQPGVECAGFAGAPTIRRLEPSPLLLGTRTHICTAPYRSRSWPHRGYQPRRRYGNFGSQAALRFSRNGRPSVVLPEVQRAGLVVRSGSSSDSGFVIGLGLGLVVVARLRARDRRAARSGRRARAWRTRRPTRRRPAASRP